MSARKDTTQVTPATFKAAKILLASGSTQAEVGEYLKLSSSSVSRINKADSYEEYKQMAKAWYCAKKKAAEEKAAKESKKEEQPVQIVEHRQNVTIQATHYMMTEMQKTNELLTAISAKLAFIVDELCGTTVKKEA